MLKNIDPEHEYESVEDELRSYVWYRDNFLCVKCSIAGQEIHHIIMKSRGGTHKANNLCLLCYECHHDEEHGTERSTKDLLKKVRKNEKRFRKNLV